MRLRVARIAADFTADVLAKRVDMGEWWLFYLEWIREDPAEEILEWITFALSWTVAQYLGHPMKERRRKRSSFQIEVDRVVQEGIALFAEDEEAVVAYAQSQEDRIVSTMTPGERMVVEMIEKIFR
jgi:hypothetical protein